MHIISKLYLCITSDNISRDILPEDMEVIIKEEINKLIRKYQNYDNKDAPESDLELSSGDEEAARKILNMRRKDSLFHEINSYARRCKECGKVLKNAVTLKGHMDVVHKKAEYRKCPLCPVNLKSIKSLRRHLTVQHPSEKKPEIRDEQPKEPREKRFMCAMCSYICGSSTSLKVHTRRHHTGERPYKCDLCPKTFVERNYMEAHRRVHTGERPFKCPICLKGFRDSSNMNHHKRTHSDIKPHKCPECGKGFLKKHNMTVHRRSQHMREDELIKCSVCNKYFDDRAQLNIHQINEDHHEEVVE